MADKTLSISIMKVNQQHLLLWFIQSLAHLWQMAVVSDTLTQVQVSLLLQMSS